MLLGSISRLVVRPLSGDPAKPGAIVPDPECSMDTADCILAGSRSAGWMVARPMTGSMRVTRQPLDDGGTDGNRLTNIPIRSDKSPHKESYGRDSRTDFSPGLAVCRNRRPGGRLPAGSCFLSGWTSICEDACGCGERARHGAIRWVDARNVAYLQRGENCRSRSDDDYSVPGLLGGQTGRSINLLYEAFIGVGLHRGLHRY